MNFEWSDHAPRYSHTPVDEDPWLEVDGPLDTTEKQEWIVRVRYRKVRACARGYRKRETAKRAAERLAELLVHGWTR